MVRRLPPLPSEETVAMLSLSVLLTDIDACARSLDVGTVVTSSLAVPLGASPLLLGVNSIERLILSVVPLPTSSWISTLGSCMVAL
jgi:hypothetical protein